MARWQRGRLVAIKLARELSKDFTELDVTAASSAEAWCGALRWTNTETVSKSTEWSDRMSEGLFKVIISVIRADEAEFIHILMVESS